MRTVRKRAFTLVELVMVIVIIGLLAAVVTPKFTSMRTEAQDAAEQAAVAAVQSGIKMAHMTALAQGNDTYPATLDQASKGQASESNPLFTEVIEGGLTDGNWEKLGKNRYRYTPTKTVYIYNKKTGQFTERKKKN